MNSYQEKLAADPLYRLGTGAMMPAMVSSQALANRVTQEANKENVEVLRWLDPLIDEGPTVNLLEELADAVFEIEIPHYLTLDRDMLKFRWAMRGKMSKKQTEAFRNAGPALALIRLINEKITDRLRRCELRDCRTYFVGDSRARWCSKKCGSRYRATKNRNPAKARKMI